MTAISTPLTSSQATKDATAILKEAGIGYAVVGSMLRRNYAGTGCDVIETAVRPLHHEDTYRAQNRLADLPGIIDSMAAYAYVSICRARNV